MQENRLGTLNVDLFIAEHAGPAPLNTRWTVLCLDLNDILGVYVNRRYAYVKSVKLCANMTVKNIFTSDTYYVPGRQISQFYLFLILLWINCYVWIFDR